MSIISPRSIRSRVLLASIALVGCDDALSTDTPAESESTPPAVGAMPPIRASVANQGAAGNCPPIAFWTGINLAANPSFEAGPGPKTWPPGPAPVALAATSWYMHSSNNQDRVSSSLVPTTVPGPGGKNMLFFSAGGNEGGVYQLVPKSPVKVMFSAWVKVESGHVVIGANAMVNMTPYWWSTKQGEWEQLRLCTDGTFPTDYFYIYNTDVNGGSFYVDRVEIKQIP